MLSSHHITLSFNTHSINLDEHKSAERKEETRQQRPQPSQKEGKDRSTTSRLQLGKAFCKSSSLLSSLSSFSSFLSADFSSFQKIISSNTPPTKSHKPFKNNKNPSHVKAVSNEHQGHTTKHHNNIHEQTTTIKEKHHNNAVQHSTNKGASTTKNTNSKEITENKRNTDNNNKLNKRGTTENKIDNNSKVNIFDPKSYNEMGVFYDATAPTNDDVEPTPVVCLNGCYDPSYPASHPPLSPLPSSISHQISLLPSPLPVNSFQEFSISSTLIPLFFSSFLFSF